MSRGAPVGWGQRPPELLERRIVITPDGKVFARSGKVEYGQGIRTGFRRIVARELHLDPDLVEVQLGETDLVPWDAGTFGSMSTATDGVTLRLAAAYAFQLLRGRAAVRLGVAGDELLAKGGAFHAPDGRTAPYGELAGEVPLEGPLPPAEELTFADGPDLPVEPDRVEALSLVLGTATYPHDVRLPGMLRGHVLAPPRPGQRLASLDDGVARAMPGVVQVVRAGDFVGVVAERREQALLAAQSLEATWSEPESEPESEREPALEAQLREDPGVEAALAQSTRRLKASYQTPHISHASILPSAAVADVRDGRADLYVATQRPFGLRDQAARILGLDPADVHVHPQQMSGMYGGGGWGDAALDAVRLSQGTGRPVLVEWTRAEEFQRSALKPWLDAEIEAALGPDGRIVAYRSQVHTNPHIYGGGRVPPEVAGMTSGRNAIPPYDLGKMAVHLTVEQGEVQTSAFRSLAAAPNVFASESFLDELAQLAGADPLALRLAHAADPRLRQVLEAVADLSGWQARPSGDGHGYGLAATIYHGTYCAEVAEVFVSAGGKVRLGRVFAAVDAGRLVYPEGARAQIEGGIVQAMSWTLFEETRLDQGRVTTRGWRDYPIATFGDAPQGIEVRFVGSPGDPSTGVGEPGAVPVAAAIANAVCAATGARLRQLPLRPGRVQKAMASS